jgi:predicted DCC family thiol-disulfide oxidoreductase YuxK
MKPVLLYDGYCNFCILIIRILELLNMVPFSAHKVGFVPLQSAGNYVKKYELKKEELYSKIHLIDEKGGVVKGNKAIARLGGYFPVIYPISALFGTKVGKVLYTVIAKNRHYILGCGDACYISRQTRN